MHFINNKRSPVCPPDKHRLLSLPHCYSKWGSRASKLIWELGRNANFGAHPDLLYQKLRRGGGAVNLSCNESPGDSDACQGLGSTAIPCERRCPAQSPPDGLLLICASSSPEPAPVPTPLQRVVTPCHGRPSHTGNLPFALTPQAPPEIGTPGAFETECSRALQNPG